MSNMEHQNKNGEWVDCNDTNGKCKRPKRPKQASGRKSNLLGGVTKNKPSPKSADLKPYIDSDNPQRMSDEDIPIYLNSKEISNDNKVKFALEVNKQRELRKNRAGALAMRKYSRNKQLREAYKNTPDYSDENLMEIYNHAEKNGYSDKLPWKKEPVVNNKGEKLGDCLLDSRNYIVARTNN